jgi:hypothetical protein
MFWPAGTVFMVLVRVEYTYDSDSVMYWLDGTQRSHVLAH